MELTWFPEASSAVTTTVVVPIGKNASAGAVDDIMTAPELSVAVAGGDETMAPAWPGSVETFTLAGTLVNTGSSTSVMKQKERKIQQRKG